MSIILILFLLLFSPSWSKREPVDGPCVYHHLLMCFLRTSSNTLSIGGDGESGSANQHK